MRLRRKTYIGAWPEAYRLNSWDQEFDKGLPARSIRYLVENGVELKEAVKTVVEEFDMVVA